MTANSLAERLPRHLKMGELRVFVAALEHRSFRKAAAVLHLSQPAVTKAIASLEDTLGVQLFDRVSNGVEPTVHGRSFAPRAVAIFDELRRAAQDLSLAQGGTHTSLRLGVVPTASVPFLPMAVKRLVDEHPGVFVSVVENTEAGLMDSLRKRDIALAMVRLSQLDANDDLQLHTRFEDALCIVAGKDHPLASQSVLTWPQLLQERWVMPPAGCGLFADVLRTLDAAQMEMPHRVVEALSLPVRLGLVMHASMLSFCLRSQIALAPGKDLLVRLPFELPVPCSAVGTVTLRSHPPGPLAEQLIAHIRCLGGTVPRRQTKALLLTEA